MSQSHVTVGLLEGGTSAEEAKPDVMAASFALTFESELRNSRLARHHSVWKVAVKIDPTSQQESTHEIPKKDEPESAYKVVHRNASCRDPYSPCSDEAQQHDLARGRNAEQPGVGDRPRNSFKGAGHVCTVPWEAVSVAKWQPSRIP